MNSLTEILFNLKEIVFIIKNVNNNLLSSNKYFNYSYFKFSKKFWTVLLVATI